ncbi:MAG: SMP-30/gluconolactonase/LRE family protein [Planctomycetia bacterium]|nr:SMP-30/gluconolactonase/LRE family protein [Planctomycetia bacterium]
MSPDQELENSPEIGAAVPAPWTVLAFGIVSPEGPAVDRSGNVFLVSRWTGRVVKVDASGQISDVVHTRGKPQSVALLESGDLLLADSVNRALCRVTPDGRLTTVADCVDGRPLLGPNDLLVGPNNLVYMTDPGLDLEAPGQVLMIDLGDGEARVLAEDLQFPNGITASADAQWLFVAESSGHRVWRYPFRDAGRSIGDGQIFHQFDGHAPDGIALDADANLLVALCGAGMLAVLSPAGEWIDSVPTGGLKCTNCVFGGADFQTLYLTEDHQQALLCMRWIRPGQRQFSRSLC